MIYSGIWERLVEMADQDPEMEMDIPNLLSQAKRLAFQSGKKLFVISPSTEQSKIEKEIERMATGSFAFVFVDFVGPPTVSGLLRKFTSISFESPFRRKPYKTEKWKVENLLDWCKKPLVDHDFGPFR